MSNSPDSPSLANSDESLRFLFEDADIRGEHVQLDAAYRDILTLHHYAPGVSRLLGEFLAASVLLSSNLKFEGRLILQVRSEGQVPLLMAECDHLLHIRGIARGAQEAVGGTVTLSSNVSYAPGATRQVSGLVVFFSLTHGWLHAPSR